MMVIRTIATMGLVAVVAACSASGASPVASQAATTTKPEATATKATDCIDSTRHGRGGPLTIADWVETSPIILVATFDGYGTPYWSTKDGARPTADMLKQDSYYLLTPVSLRVDSDGEIKGKAGDADGAVEWGGQLGCDSFRDEGYTPLEKGQTYVFFVAETSLNGERLPALAGAWPVGPDGVVIAPAEGPRSLDQLEEELRAGKAEGPDYTISPNEPSGNGG